MVCANVPKAEDGRAIKGTVIIKTSCAKGPTTVQITVQEEPAGNLQAQVSFYGY